MANPITTAAAFATLNMKPQPNEQVDALWGQNIADNTGYVYFRQERIPDGGVSHTGQIYVFQKKSSHNGIKIVFLDGTGSQSITAYARIFQDGTNPSWSTGGVLTATMARNQVPSSYTRYDMDISSLNNGSYYAMTLFDGIPTITTYTQIWQTYGSGASY